MSSFEEMLKQAFKTEPAAAAQLTGMRKDKEELLAELVSSVGARMIASAVGASITSLVTTGELKSVVTPPLAQLGKALSVSDGIDALETLVTQMPELWAQTFKDDPITNDALRATAAFLRRAATKIDRFVVNQG